LAGPDLTALGVVRIPETWIPRATGALAGQVDAPASPGINAPHSVEGILCSSRVVGPQRAGKLTGHDCRPSACTLFERGGARAGFGTLNPCESHHVCN